ncbi:MAG: hypothetical protein MI755_18165 [Sphingomonadales bacterium]|nr:hypothetical protein [Sphingomonadales bacterium]
MRFVSYSHGGDAGVGIMAARLGHVPKKALSYPVYTQAEIAVDLARNLHTTVNAPPQSDGGTP